jgi:hypothetical protein
MPEYIDRRAAAEYLTKRGLKIAFNTLQKMATTGDGPPYRRFGARVVYTIAELNVWAAEKLGEPQSSTSQRRKAA